MNAEPAAMIEEEAARWAVRIDRGLTGDERAALDAWLAGDDRKRGALLRAQAAWSVLDRARVLAGGDEDARPGLHAWPRRRILQLGGCAAAVALMVAGGLAWAPWPNTDSFATATGEIRRLPLEDGSLAMMNSGSEIRVAYRRDRRDVELSQGEAWFKVAKNADRPFIVSAGPVRVEAVGTAFDVRRHERSVEVTVTEGIVKVWSADASGDPTLVNAGHRARIDDRAGIEVAGLSAASLDQRLAWQEGRIVLDDMTLAAAAAEFNRYNDVKLEIAPSLADEKVVGWFRFDDLDGFVNATVTLTGGRVEREGDIVRIVK